MKTSHVTGAIAVGFMLSLGNASLALARDTVLNPPFDEAVEQAIKSGKIDGSVKFYLPGKAPDGGSVLRADAVTNKKTNGVGKSDQEGCQWALFSALITLQQAATNAGGNAVRNIVSFYKRKESSNPNTYECHAGSTVIGVTLKGDIVKY
jgi:hypothetical protein